MSSIPFPSNDHVPLPPQVEGDPKRPPWKQLKSSEATPMSFEVRFRNGRIRRFAYCDFRDSELVHPGHLVIGVLGM